MNPHYPQGNVLYRNLHVNFPLITHGLGAFLFDEEGHEYLDASGGAAVVNIGHGSKELAEALSQQARKVAYLSGQHFSHPPVESLAKRIAEFLPFSEAKVFFLASGSEAVEAAVKLSRQYWFEQGKTEKFQVISRRPSYHGNTFGALAFSAREHYKTVFKPFLKENLKIPAPYCYRCFCGEEYPSCGLKCAIELEKGILSLGKDTVSAFVTEVIGGSSTGAAVPPLEYFQRIREICDKYEILLIADEVMTGIGRTGKWLACEHFGLVPDIVIMGKGLTSGYVPLSAVAAKGSIIDVLYRKGRNFLHAQTYAQHPVGCAAGLAVMDIIQKNDLIQKSAELGEILFHELSHLHSHPNVGDIRGKGLFAGLEFVKEKNSRMPFPRREKFVERFLSHAFQKGLVLWPNTGHADGVNGDLVMIAPPLIVSQKEISLLRKRLTDVLDMMEN